MSPLSTIVFMSIVVMTNSVAPSGIFKMFKCGVATCTTILLGTNYFFVNALTSKH